MMTNHIFLVVCLASLQISYVTSQNSIISFIARTHDESPNEVVLQCMGQRPYRFVLTDPINNTISFTVDDVMSTYTLTVTPETEKIVSCIASGDSEPNSALIIQAFPEHPNDEEKRLALIGMPIELECPYKLGITKDILEPYELQWFEEGSFTTSLSNQAKLNVTVTETSVNMYSCAVLMSLCNDTAQCPSAQQLPSQEDRVIFNITKVEPISNMTGPVVQNVTKGDEATFNCSAYGDNIEIIWQVNGINISNVDDCSNGGTCAQLCQSETFVSSMLTVPTDQIENTSSVRCIVHQSFNGSISSQFNNADYPGSNLPDRWLPSSVVGLFVNEPPTTPPTSTTTSTPTGMSQRVSTGPTMSPYVVPITVIAGIFILAVTVVIVVVVIVITCHYHYKVKGDSSKLGRFIRSVSRPGSKNVQSNHDYPVTSNGTEISPECFGPTPPLPHQSIPLDSMSKPEEPLYNASQYSGASGGSGYSGLSGVSNQQPGMEYKMPQYPSGTDVSAASLSHNGRLAPPSRSRKSSDFTDQSGRSHRSSGSSVHNNPHPPTLELLTQHNPINGHGRASSYNPIPHTGYSHNGYPSTNYHASQVVAQQLYSHSDNGYTSQSHPHLYQPHASPRHGAEPNPLPPPHHSPAHRHLEQGLFRPPPIAPFPRKPEEPETPTPLSAPFPHSSKPLSDEVIKQVMDCLMHNRNCRIPNCPCYTVRKRYSKTCRQERQEPDLSIKSQYSSGSDSDSTAERRLKLRLPLASEDPPEIHPHYHPPKKTRVRSDNPRVQLERRRSKSLDLTPVIECSETPAKTPKVGGALLAGTPLYPRTFEDAVNHLSILPNEPDSANGPYALLREISLSADNLPTLCLNDCPFTPTPLKENKSMNSKLPPLKRQHSVSAAVKPALSTIGEKKSDGGDSEASNTSSRSDSPTDVKTSQSDSDEAIVVNSYHGDSVNDSITSAGRNGGLKHWGTIDDGPIRALSQGYHSETMSSSDNSLPNNYYRLLPNTPQKLSSVVGSDHSQRSSSPAYETVVTHSDHDGSTIHTTEC